ncbi:MAG TPA: tetratricopeptide repeat protein, partial [Pirellulales bacterium]|nr:tetratricopeptide repeat protein [Pirellulales bacterium]
DALPPVAAPPDSATGQGGQSNPRSVDELTAADFAGQGELDFKAGKYESASRNFRHALVDDPANAAVLMMLSQSLFAMGQYDEAAGATAMAMQSLPQDKWGVVVENRQQLYGNARDYADQLRSLEKARDAKSDSPGLHFLLGFQYAFSGNPSGAASELDKVLQLEPRDQMAKALRDATKAKLDGTASPAGASERGGTSPPPLQAPSRPQR